MAVTDIVSNNRKSSAVASCAIPMMMWPHRQMGYHTNADESPGHHRLWPKLASLPISPMNPVNIYRDRRKSSIGINKGRRRIVVTAFGRLVDVSVESDHSS